jgi:hypothetical protein
VALAAIVPLFTTSPVIIPAPPNIAVALAVELAPEAIAVAEIVPLFEKPPLNEVKKKFNARASADEPFAEAEIAPLLVKLPLS